MRGGTFGSRVKQRRTELGLTLRRLSELTGLAASTLSRVENDRYSPTYDNAVRLTAALVMPLEVDHAAVDADVPPAGSAERDLHGVPLSEHGFHADKGETCRRLLSVGNLSMAS